VDIEGRKAMTWETILMSPLMLRDALASFVIHHHDFVSWVRTLIIAAIFFGLYIFKKRYPGEIPIDRMSKRTRAIVVVVSLIFVSFCGFIVGVDATR